MISESAIFIYISDMELNDFKGNFNEFIVETRDPVKNHDFCCGCIQIPLSIPTSMVGVPGLTKLIISLIYRDVLGIYIHFSKDLLRM